MTTKIILGQKIRLDLNNVQETILDRWAGASRFVYNWGLQRWKEIYEAGEKPSWQALSKELNGLKKTDHTWLAQIPWKVSCQALQDLGAAFQNFFRRRKTGRKPGYPKFKSKRDPKQGFAIEGRALLFDSKRVKIPKLGWIRTRQELRFPGKILSARFTRRSNHWYLSIHVEVDDSYIYPHPCETQEVVGVDLGVRDLAVLSTEEKIEAPRILRKMEDKLRRLNKELHRRKKGGRNREKTRRKLSRLYDRIKNIRENEIHELTTKLVSQFRGIGIEDLNIQGMARGLNLAKSVYDASLAEIRRQLKYKAPLAGSEIFVADRWFPSSKICSFCGVVLDALPLSFREWWCVDCDTLHDRDINAALNLRTVAYTEIAQRLGSSDPSLKVVKLLTGWEPGIAASPG